MVALIVPRAAGQWRAAPRKGAAQGLRAGLVGILGLVESLGLPGLIALLLATATPAAAGPLAFVTNQGSDSVSVVDLDARRVVKEIAVGKAPAGVAVSAAAGRAFVTNPGEHSLAVIDLARLETIARIPAGQGAVGVAVSPDGRRVYVADWYGGRLRAWDAASLAPLGEIAVGTAPAGLAVSADGRRVYVAARDDDAVVEVSIDEPAAAAVASPLAWRVSARLPVGSHPFAIGIAPDGRTLVALNVQSDDVSLVDLVTRQPLARLKVGLAPYGVAFDAARGRAFVTNQHATTVSVIDLAARRVVAEHPGGEYPEGIAYLPPAPTGGGASAPAGTPGMAGILLVVSWMDDCLHLVDAASGQRLASIDTGRNPRGFGEMVWWRP